MANPTILPRECEGHDEQQESVIFPSEEEITQIISGTHNIYNHTQANFSYKQSYGQWWEHKIMAPWTFYWGKSRWNS